MIVVVFTLRVVILVIGCVEAMTESNETVAFDIEPVAVVCPVEFVNTAGTVVVTFIVAIVAVLLVGASVDAFDSANAVLTDVGASIIILVN